MSRRVPDAAHPAPDRTDPAHYVCWMEERVRFADLDVLGHVNNVATSVYFESGRIALLMQADLYAASGPFHNVVVHVAMDYLREIRFPSTVRIGTRVERIGRTSFDVGCGMFVEDACVATGLSVFVRLANQAGRPVPLSDAERARLASLMSRATARSSDDGDPDR